MTDAIKFRLSDFKPLEQSLLIFILTIYLPNINSIRLEESKDYEYTVPHDRIFGALSLSESYKLHRIGVKTVKAVCDKLGVQPPFNWEVKIEAARIKAEQDAAYERTRIRNVTVPMNREQAEDIVEFLSTDLVELSLGKPLRNLIYDPIRRKFGL